MEFYIYNNLCDKKRIVKITIYNQFLIFKYSEHKCCVENILQENINIDLLVAFVELSTFTCVNFTFFVVL